MPRISMWLPIAWNFNGIGHVPKRLCCPEEFRKVGAMTVAYSATCDLVLNPENYADNRKGHYTKVMQYVASLGISKADLPQVLRGKLETWLVTGGAEAPQEKKKKKRASKPDPEDEPPKKRGGPAAGNKRQRKR